VCVHLKACTYLDQLGKGLIDKNERDQNGEDLLGEARDETNKEAPLHCHNHHHNDDQPHAHPDTAHNVLKAIRLAELNGKDESQCLDG